MKKSWITPELLEIGMENNTGTETDADHASAS